MLLGLEGSLYRSGTAGTPWNCRQLMSGEQQAADPHALAIACCLPEGMPACRPRPATDRHRQGTGSLEVGVQTLQVNPLQQNLHSPPRTGHRCRLRCAHGIQWYRGHLGHRLCRPRRGHRGVGLLLLLGLWLFLLRSLPGSLRLSHLRATEIAPSHAARCAGTELSCSQEPSV